MMNLQADEEEGQRFVKQVALSPLEEHMTKILPNSRLRKLILVPDNARLLAPRDDMSIGSPTNARTMLMKSSSDRSIGGNRSREDLFKSKRETRWTSESSSLSPPIRAIYKRVNGNLGNTGMTSPPPRPPDLEQHNARMMNRVVRPTKTTQSKPPVSPTSSKSPPATTSSPLPPKSSLERWSSNSAMLDSTTSSSSSSSGRCGMSSSLSSHMSWKRTNGYTPRTTTSSLLPGIPPSIPPLPTFQRYHSDSFLVRPERTRSTDSFSSSSSSDGEGSNKVEEGGVEDNANDTIDSKT